MSYLPRDPKNQRPPKNNRLFGSCLWIVCGIGGSLQVHCPTTIKEGTTTVENTTNNPTLISTKCSNNTARRCTRHRGKLGGIDHHAESVGCAEEAFKELTTLFAGAPPPSHHHHYGQQIFQEKEQEQKHHEHTYRIHRLHQ